MNDTDRERWRGRVDAELRTLDDKVKTLFAQNRDCEDHRQTMEVILAKLGVKMGLFSTIGALIGGGLAQVVIALWRHQP